MHLVPYFLSVTVTQIVAGFLVTGSSFRRWLAALVAALALGLPWLAPPSPPWIRSLIALGLVMAFLRTLDLAKEKRERSLLFRIVHVMTPFDTRRLHRAEPSVPIAELPQILLYFVLVTLSFQIARTTQPAGSHFTRDVALRWGAGLVLAYSITEVAYRGVEIAIRALGFNVYAFHRTPAASLSVKEFWGQRWNLTVMATLREHCLRPIAKHGYVKLGLLAAFVASAALHAYLAIVSVGVFMTILTFAYFFVQGLLVLFEIAVRMEKRNRIARRVWTLGVMIATSPLFVEPALRVLGI